MPSAVVRPCRLLVKNVFACPGGTDGATGPAGVNFMIVTPVPWRLLEALKLETSTSPGAILPPDGKSLGTKTMP
jgi:hypothetical protein